jgi:hypothetical protein
MSRACRASEVVLPFRSGGVHHRPRNVPAIYRSQFLGTRQRAMGVHTAQRGFPAVDPSISP